MVSSEQAQALFWRTAPEVRAIILAQAEQQVESLTSRLDALNQRLSALCGLLFAAAAVAVGVALNAGHASTPATTIACCASAVFVLAAVAGFVGLWSGQTAFKGEALTWWAAQGEEAMLKLTKADAEYWIAGRLQASITSLAKAVRRRGRAFNLAIVLASVGGALIVATAIASTKASPPATPSSPCAKPAPDARQGVLPATSRVAARSSGRHPPLP